MNKAGAQGDISTSQKAENYGMKNEPNTQHKDDLKEQSEKTGEQKKLNVALGAQYIDPGIPVDKEKNKTKDFDSDNAEKIKEQDLSKRMGEAIGFLEKHFQNLSEDSKKKLYEVLNPQQSSST